MDNWMVWYSCNYCIILWMWRTVNFKNYYNPDSPRLTRISDPTTTNQSRCVGVDITPIRYEIFGAASGADVTGIDNLKFFEQLTSDNQVDRFVITGLMTNAGDVYTLTIDQVPYTVTIGEDTMQL